MESPNPKFDLGGKKMCITLLLPLYEFSTGQFPLGVSIQETNVITTMRYCSWQNWPVNQKGHNPIVWPFRHQVGEANRKKGRWPLPQGKGGWLTSDQTWSVSSNQTGRYPSLPITVSHTKFLLWLQLLWLLSEAYLQLYISALHHIFQCTSMYHSPLKCPLLIIDCTSLNHTSSVSLYFTLFTFNCTYPNDPRIVTYVRKQLTFFRLLSRLNELDLCGPFF